MKKRFKNALFLMACGGLLLCLQKEVWLYKFKITVQLTYYAKKHLFTYEIDAPNH